jgi:RNA polymerase sigma-70 factor (ECF subfamily)
MHQSMKTCVPSDQQLVEKTCLGNRDAFGELVTRHYPVCLSVANRVLRDRADAQDAVQDAMRKAFTHLGQYREEGPFLPWLLRIVVNYSLTRVRVSRRRFVYIDSGWGPDGSVPVQLRAVAADQERQLIIHERWAIVEQEILRLPPLFRTVVLLRDAYELPLADIADRLNSTVSAIISRLVRARAELRERVIRRYV